MYKSSSDSDFIFLLFSCANHITDTMASSINNNVSIELYPAQQTLTYLLAWRNDGEISYMAGRSLVYYVNVYVKF